MTAVDSAGIYAALSSHGLASGLFERVNGHEPKNSPGNGLSLAIWTSRILPAVESSGLNSVTGRLVFNNQAMYSKTAEPADGMERLLLSAVDALIRTYSGDFELGGLVRNVDILGQHGEALGARFGYVTIDSKLYRHGTITLSLVVNDLWAEAP
jgi:hypothetical protein